MLSVGQGLARRGTAAEVSGSHPVCGVLTAFPVPCGALLGLSGHSSTARPSEGDLAHGHRHLRGCSLGSSVSGGR